MRKNLKRYYQAWLLRKEGLKLREIGDKMVVSRERIRAMVKYMDFYLKKRGSKIPIKLKNNKNCD